MFTLIFIIMRSGKNVLSERNTGELCQARFMECDDPTPALYCIFSIFNAYDICRYG
jgi:hypothetical protein